MKLTLAEAAIGAGAVLEAPASVANAGALGSRGYSIDSRTVADGELFFAVRGERHDGHDYVAAAIVQRRSRAPEISPFAFVEQGSKDLGRQPISLS